jgi:Rieske Fe-S protein
MKTTRRTFLSRCLMFIGAALGWRVFHPVLSEAKNAPDWYKIGKLEDFEVGKPVQVQKGRHHEKDVPVKLSTMFVLRDANGVKVLSAACPHRGCDVHPDRNGGFVCPCHGAQFDAAGQVLKGPAKTALPELPTRVENGEVLVFTTK